MPSKSNSKGSGPKGQTKPVGPKETQVAGSDMEVTNADDL